MGIMSRRVIPTCGKLCCFCASFRPRSRAPVKRYKKLLYEIFHQNQESGANDRKIGKLCEYASRNPLRIPEITDYLELKCYKDLRHETSGIVKVVLCVYKKLLSSCKELMPLFSYSLISVVRALLEQTRRKEVQILGCNTLVDFIGLQSDKVSTFNWEGLIPKLCQITQDLGDDELSLRLRSAGMQALAYMISFMAEQSQILDLDLTISLILENYMDLENGLEHTREVGQCSRTDSQRTSKAQENDSSFRSTSRRLSFKLNPLTDYKFQKMDISKSPSYWSMVCLCNIARLAKETTTVRRVLVPLFNTFDGGNHWSPLKGTASSVLTFLQSRLEESGEGSHMLISTLIKHLDHKNVVKKQGVQVNIVHVTTCLLQNAKKQISGVITVVADLVKHLQKCLQNVAVSALSTSELNQYSKLQHALETCLAELSYKIGDVGPILDILAVILETISTNVIVSRTTTSAVLRAAYIVSEVPNVPSDKKVFPDALFHQLLLLMSHSDCETRVGAHSIFSVLLLPALLLPWSDQHKEISKVEVEKFLNKELGEEGNHNSKLSQKFSWQSLNSLKDVTDGIKSLSSFRLSSHQVNLLLSSLWIQATSTTNTPANFEAMAHTYNITFFFSQAKKSRNMALPRCFQLAFSLRKLSLEGNMQAFHRRSLFTFASYMLISAAKISNLQKLIPIVKTSLAGSKVIDPYLELEGDIKLQAVCSKSPHEIMVTEEDIYAAFKSLSVTVLNDTRLKETVISHLVMRYDTLAEDSLSNMRKQIQLDFFPDNAHPRQYSCSSLPAFEEVELSERLPYTGTYSKFNENQSNLSNTTEIQSVDELLNSLSLLETSSFSIPSMPVSYEEMMSQCTALVICKQQMMSSLYKSFDLQKSDTILLSEDAKMKLDEGKAQDSNVKDQHSFQLPPSNPYDHFLKTLNSQTAIY